MAKSDRHPQFDIKLGSGWQEQTVYTYSGPELDGVYHSLVIALDRQVGKRTLSEYAHTRIEQTLTARPDARSLKSEERQLASGQTVFEFAYAVSPAPQQTQICKTWFMLLDGIAYIFTASFSKKTAKTIGRDVEKIIESFTPVE